MYGYCVVIEGKPITYTHTSDSRAELARVANEKKEEWEKKGERVEKVGILLHEERFHFSTPGNEAERRDIIQKLEKNYDSNYVYSGHAESGWNGRGRWQNVVKISVEWL